MPLTFEMVVAGRQLDNGARRRRRHDGRGRRHRGFLGATTPRAPRRSTRRRSPPASRPPRPGSRTRSRCSASSSRCGHETQGPIVPMELGSRRSTTPRGVRRRRPPLRVTASRSPAADRRQGRAQRRHRGRLRRRSWLAQLCRRAADRRAWRAVEKQGQGRLPQPHQEEAVRKRIVDEGARIDGRGPRDLRPLVQPRWACMPTAHGTGLFQRGETQVMNVCTLGMPRMDQMLDTLDPVTNKRYLFHYNMAAVLQRRAGLHARRRSAARSATARSPRSAVLPVRALDRGVPLHAPPGVRGAVLQRLHLDGVGLRARACR
jgi:hypothetical protein